MITIIAGTNRPNAVSLEIAKLYSQILNNRKVNNQIVDLGKLPNDFTASALYENAGKNDGFNLLRNSMAASDKFVFVVPEYNGSFPGVLKAFIDGLQFPDTFKNKKAALVGLSAGIQGAGIALSHMTDILNYCGTHVLAVKPKLMTIGNHLKDGVLSDLYQQLLEEQAEAFIAF